MEVDKSFTYLVVTRDLFYFWEIFIPVSSELSLSIAKASQPHLKFVSRICLEQLFLGHDANN